MNTLYSIMILTEEVAAKAPMEWWLKALLISLGIGLVVGLAYAFMLKGQLTSVYKNDSASDYTKDKSFKVEHRRDTFMYSKTTKTEKPKNN